MRSVWIIHPKDFKKRMGIKDGVDIWWVYWTPYGDEAMAGYLFGDITFEFVSDWEAYLELLELNPHLKNINLGSSDYPPENVLLFVKDRAYICGVFELDNVIHNLRITGEVL